MPPRRAPRIAAAATAFFAASLVLAACSGATPEAETSPTPTMDAPAATSPAVTPEATPTASAEVDPTCASLIPEQTVSDFEAAGWTSREQPFRIGSIELSEGLWCEWADFTVTGDHLQSFGWAPIEAAQADTAQDELLASGWIREDGADGVYITENPDMTISADPDGYGMTYLFGDGWVTVADWKQSLVLVERPPS